VLRLGHAHRLAEGEAGVGLLRVEDPAAAEHQPVHRHIELGGHGGGDEVADPAGACSAAWPVIGVTREE
jgi:hypothetical protein